MFESRLCSLGVGVRGTLHLHGVSRPTAVDGGSLSFNGRL